MLGIVFLDVHSFEVESPLLSKSPERDRQYNTVHTIHRPHWHFLLYRDMFFFLPFNQHSKKYSFRRMYHSCQCQSHKHKIPFFQSQAISEWKTLRWKSRQWPIFCTSFNVPLLCLDTAGHGSTAAVIVVRHRNTTFSTLILSIDEDVIQSQRKQQVARLNLVEHHLTMDLTTVHWPSPCIASTVWNRTRLDQWL